MTIASKEARKTEYRLKLIAAGNLIKIPLDTCLLEINELNKILTSIENQRRYL